VLHPLYLSAPPRSSAKGIGRALRPVIFPQMQNYGTMSEAIDALRAVIAHRGQQSPRVPVPIEIDPAIAVEKLAAGGGKYGLLEVGRLDDGRQMVLAGFVKSRSALIFLHDGRDALHLGRVWILPFAFGFTSSMASSSAKQFRLRPGPARHGFPGGADFRLVEKKGRRSVSLILPSPETTDLFNVSLIAATLEKEARHWAERAFALPDIYWVNDRPFPLMGEDAPDGGGHFANPGILPLQSHPGSHFDAWSNLVRDGGSYLLARAGINHRCRIRCETVSDLKEPWRALSFNVSPRRDGKSIPKEESAAMCRLLWEMGECSAMAVKPTKLARSAANHGIGWLDDLSSQTRFYESAVDTRDISLEWVAAEFCESFSAHQKLELLMLEREARERLRWPVEGF
jgi:hypothetical protein